ncbi:TIGR02453 family protein [Chitinophaga flava]|uniref:TIGR02453 family protein n=2 Tax=Chitinophaga flava TaxID=2259036 RepID=A0A365Y6I4_9BACT|nr:TIGR02453 family protein [Chitinophaga flava]
MLQPSTLKFLKSLKLNNNKVWFDEHRDNYLAAKTDFESMVQQLIDGMAKQDTTLAGLQLKDCVFRIYKDVRFSKDKTPYKINLAASFQAGGKKSLLAGYYFHLEPGGNSFAGGGLWMPAAPELKKVRQEIDYNFEEFESIISNKSFIKHFGKVEGDALKTVPQGYQPDNPAIAYLKLKSLIVTHPISDETCVQPSLVREILKTFALMQPLIQFINRAMD